MKITIEDILQWEQALKEMESSFTTNRNRIRELKRLILISENPQEYQKFQEEEKQQINTLNCKTEMSKLILKNDKLKKQISELKKGIATGKATLMQ